METKRRYKMHKVKKHWVTVAVASGLITLGTTTLGSSVSAETEQQTSDKVVTQKSEDDKAASESSQTDAPKTKQAQTEQTQAQSQANVADTSTSITKETPSQNITTQANSDDKTVTNTKSEEAQTTASSQALTQAKAELTKQRQTAAQENKNPVDLAAIPNVKQIDGKYYYIGSDGQPKKNFALTVNNKVLYFDKNTGALTDTSQYQFKQGLTKLNNDYTPHNQIVNFENTSLETIDNYVTADSWYRPKDILKNGKTWTASSESDLRPLLMSWWPDKQTQIAYLNYMNQQGLGTGENYTADSSQESLNLAAQTVQVKIETKISQTQQTQWLRDIINSFVKTQPNWNSQTESDTSAGEKDHLQGGALLYSNSDKTAYANSDYRLLNRTPTSQTGKPKYFEDNSSGGYDFLLANDIDNSNPVVQAEQLNWLHYLMNYGSIVANDPEANFDGVRVDAVDNVNADLLQIASDYLKAHYGVDKSEKNAINHLSILEAWSDNDPQYNKDTKGAQLPIDNKLRLSLLYALTRPLEKDASNKNEIRSGLEPVITNSLNNRSAEGKNSERMANYIFIRAHDSEVQTVIAKIIKAQINPKTDGLTFTLDELKQAFKIYNEDMRQAKKKYTQSNIPTAYALMLSNKDSITRLYYGDMYSDDGQYMATKSPYYDAIDTLLKARIKYAAGGQDMKITYVEGDKSHMDWDYTGVLTSVRYGTGANEATDQGSEATKTQGMAVITSNNPSLKLNQNDKVIVNMGAAHKNQEYRPLLLTTKDGLTSYTSDAAAKSLYRKTNDKGELVFDASDIQGYLNPQVSGYLAVWVPVGASDNQDVRVAASNKANDTGQVYESSSALDSQLIYEGFSNFQDFVTKDSDYTNKKIAQNVQLFKSWGVTSFEMAPQYVSSEDGSFLDSIIQNGYAFEDRYDLAMSKNNKYGYFPAISLAWNAHEEDFIKKIEAISNLRLRGSFGMTGNNQIPSYQSLAQLAKNKVVLDGNKVEIGRYTSNIANDNLKWESQKQYNIGLDLSFLKNRYTFSTELYYKRIDDMLLEVNIPSTSGFQKAWKNAGSMENKGLEVSFNAQWLREGDFKWTTDFNISFYRNKILSLDEGQYQQFYDRGINSKIKSDVLLRVGMPVGIYYGYVADGVFHNQNEVDNAQPGPNVALGGLRVKDINHDGVIDTNDRVPVADVNPLHTGGIGNTFSYKGWELYAFLRWSYGNDVVNGNAYYLTGTKNIDNITQSVYNNVWSEAHPDRNFPLFGGGFWAENAFRSDLVEDGSFLRLQTVSLSYNLPKEVLEPYKLNKLRIGVTGTNLALWTRYSGFDPEANTGYGTIARLAPGLDMSPYPRPTSVLFSVEVGF